MQKSRLLILILSYLLHSIGFARVDYSQFSESPEPGNLVNASIPHEANSLQLALLEQMKELTNLEYNGRKIFDRVFRQDGAAGDVFLQIQNNNVDFISPLTSETLAQSENESVYIFEPTKFSGNVRENRMVAIKKDIFFEGFYRTNRYADKESETFSHFISAQPWFEFKEGQYILQIGESAGTQLLKHLLGEHKSVTLYRGVKYRPEVEMLFILQQLQNQQMTAQKYSQLKNVLITMHESDRISDNDKSVYQEILRDWNAWTAPENQLALFEKLMDAKYKDGEAGHEGTFFSDQIELAKEYGGWKSGSKPVPLLKVEISGHTLHQLLQKKLIYVGYEYNYFELMFKGKNAVKELLPSLTFIQPN